MGKFLQAATTQSLVINIYISEATINGREKIPSTMTQNDPLFGKCSCRVFWSYQKLSLPRPVCRHPKETSTLISKSSSHIQISLTKGWMHIVINKLSWRSTVLCSFFSRAFWNVIKTFLFHAGVSLLEIQNNCDTCICGK